MKAVNSNSRLRVPVPLPLPLPHPPVNSRICPATAALIPAVDAAAVGEAVTAVVVVFG